jgi:hypothetical protein
MCTYGTDSKDCEAEKKIGERKEHEIQRKGLYG